MASTNFVVKNGLTVASGTVVAGGSSGTSGQVLSSTGTGVQWVNAATGTGDVVGPASATDNAVVRFDGTTGKLIQNSTVTLSDTGVLTVPELSTTSITSTGNNPIIIAPDGTGDVHLNADSVRIGDNNTDATLVTRGTGDLLLTTNEGSAVEGVIRIYDGANGNITLTPNGTGQVQVGSDQVVTLIASQTLTNKTLSSNSVWNGNVIGSAYGGAGTVNGILKANGSGTVSAASAGTDYVTSVSVTSPVSNTGTTANPTIALASGYGDTQNPYGSKTANYFLASPNGSAGVPTFRAIVAADIPTLNQNTTGTAANITATSNTTLTTLSSLVSIGTITTGTWNASAIGVAYGGTGLTSLTAGYIPYGNGTSAFGSSANLFWDSTNSRLGVGTTSPAQRLTVSGGNLLVNSANPDVGGIYLQATTGTNACAMTFDNSGGKGYVGLDSSAGSRISGVAYALSVWHEGNNPIAFGTNNTERMRITSGGNVGIGVTPSSKLHIANPANTNTYLQIAQTSVESWQIGMSANSTALAFLNSGSEKMRLTDSGSLGIGTSSPSLPLHVYNSGAALAYFESTNANGPYVIWRSSGTSIGDVGSGKGISGSGNVTDFMIASRSTYPMILGTGSTERMRIDSSGNVGIGVTPSAWYPSVYTAIDVGASSCFGGYASGASGDELTFVAGNVYFNSSNTPIYKANGFATNYRQFNGVHQWFNAPSGTAGNAITFTQAMTLDASGNLGLGTSSPDIFGRFYTRSVGISSSGSTILQINGSSYGGIDLGAASIRTGSITGSANDIQMGSITSIPLLFVTNGSERMRIDSSGNVGIGGTASSGTRLYVVGSNTTSNTSIPIYANQVYGNTGVSSAALRLNLNDGAGGCYLYGYSGGAGFMHNAEYLAGTGWTARSTFASIMETTSSGFSFYLNSSLTAGNTFTPSEQMRLTSTGLGIGTSSPSAKLQVNSSGITPLNLVGSTACQINLNDGTQNANWGLGVGGVGITGIASPSTYPLVMYTNGSERMRITSGGDVGIGRTPSYTLDLAGDARFKRNSGSGWVFQTPSSDMRIVGETSGAHLCFIPSSANVGIDTTSPSEKLNVIGKIKASDVLLGNNGTKGYGAITTTTSTSTPTGGSSGDHYYIY